MMMCHKIFALVMLMLLSMVTAHADSSDPEDNPGDDSPPGLDLAAVDCQASDISLGLVRTCTCRSAENVCPKCHLQDDANAGLINCYAPCDSDNRECKACDIFYGGVCNCLKIMSGISTGTKCIGNTAWQGPGNGLPPVWILGSDSSLGSRLISSTILNTGIDQLANIPDNNAGWTLGLQHIDTSKQALAINSRARRSRDEIHIHLCNKLTGANSPQVRLATLNPSNYVTFQAIGSWYCKATKPTIPVKPNTDSWQTRPSTDYLAWVATTVAAVNSINNQGFALLTDSNNNYLWQCITTLETDVTEYTFCGP
jgi:hypothetical protein